MARQVRKGTLEMRSADDGEDKLWQAFAGDGVVVTVNSVGGGADGLEAAGANAATVQIVATSGMQGAA